MARLYLVCFLGETQLISLQISLCHDWTDRARVFSFIAKLVFALSYPRPYEAEGFGYMWIEA